MSNSSGQQYLWKAIHNNTQYLQSYFVNKLELNYIQFIKKNEACVSFEGEKKLTVAKLFKWFTLKLNIILINKLLDMHI